MSIQKIPLGASEGGIAEEVTNANGTAVKFESGLMICKHELSVPAITASFGTLFRSSSAATWTFPQVFVGDSPSVSGNDKNSSQVWGGFSSNLTSATATGVFIQSLSGSRTFVLTAIGRWKA